MSPPSGINSIAIGAGISSTPPTSPNCSNTADMADKRVAKLPNYAQKYLSSLWSDNVVATAQAVIPQLAFRARDPIWRGAL